MRKYYDYFVKIGNEYFHHLNELYTDLDKSNMFDKAWEVGSHSVSTYIYYYCCKYTMGISLWVKIDVRYESSYFHHQSNRMISQIDIYFILSDTCVLDTLKDEIAKSKLSYPYNMGFSFKYVNGYITEISYFQYIEAVSLTFTRDSTISDDIKFKEMCKAYEGDTRNQTIKNYKRILDCLKLDFDARLIYHKEYSKKEYSDKATYLDKIDLYVEDTIIDEIKKKWKY